jgi:YD repeat-containing protein
MKTLIILIVSCLSALGADTGIRVFTSSTTNASFIHTQDIYTRDGQTNLIRITDTKAGVVQIQIHRFYHDGSFLGYFEVAPESSGFVAETGSGYSMSFEFSQSKDAKSAVIGKSHEVVDAFTCTNGVFIPVESPFGKSYAVGTPSCDRVLRDWTDQLNRQPKN